MALWAKRLESGTFQLPSMDAEATSVELSATQLALFLGGIDLASVRQRNRYQNQRRRVRC